MADTYKGKPVYVHTSGQYYMYWQDDYKNWHAWVEIGSMYAGFFAYGRNTKALSSIISSFFTYSISILHTI